MGRRLQLQTRLENLLVTEEEPDKKTKVYFQPPANMQMEFPCIVYQRDNAKTKFAGNSPYRFTKRYQVMIISEDPDDDELIDATAALPMCEYQRFFVANNLNHDVFSMYF